MVLTVKILTTHETALCDAVLTELLSEEPRMRAPWLWLERKIDAALVLDEEGQSHCDALVILGRDLEAEVLSACDLAGVRVLGIIADSRDEETLDRLRLRERLRLPLSREGLAQALGLSSGAESPQDRSTPARVAPGEKVTTRPSTTSVIATKPPPRRHDPVERASVGVTSVGAPDTPVSERDARHDDDDLVAGRWSGRVIAVWGAKGSPGVTSTALSLAAVAAVSGQRVVLVDADVHGAAVATLCDILDEAPGIVALSRAASRDNLTDDTVRRYAVPVIRGKVRFDVVTGITDANRWPEIEPESVVKVLDTLSAAYDSVIVDVGFSLESDEEISSDLNAPRRNGATVACLHRADRVVTVTTPDPVALSRFILALPRLREIVDTSAWVTCVNKVCDKSGGFASASAVRDTLRRFADIPRIVAIPEDRDTLRRSMSSATPAPWMAPRGPWRQAITKLWQDASA